MALNKDYMRIVTFFNEFLVGFAKTFHVKLSKRNIIGYTWNSYS